MTDVDPATAVIWPKWCYSVVKKAPKPIILPLTEKTKISDSGLSQKRRRKRPACEAGFQGRSEGTEPGYRSGSPETPSGSGSSSPAASSSSEALSGSVPAALAVVPPSTVTSYSDLMRQLAAKYNNPESTRYSSPATAYGSFNSFDYGHTAKPLENGPTYSDRLPAASIDNLQSTPFLNTTSALPFTCLPYHLTAFSRLPMLDLMRRSPMSIPVSVAKEPRITQLSDSAAKILPPTACGSSRKRSRSPDPPIPPVSSPLDLSAIKRSRQTQQKISSNTGATQESSRTSPVVNSGKHVCTNSAAPEEHSVASWSVSEVLKFVESVNDCSEYVKLFEEHRINGRALAMIKAEYLTNILGMKLGPALQFCAELGNKLGVCPTCAHCSHCHSNQDSSPMKKPSTSPPSGLLPASHCLSPSSAATREAEQSAHTSPTSAIGTTKSTSPITADS